jgi:hypothetical protein
MEVDYRTAGTGSYSVLFKDGDSSNLYSVHTEWRLNMRPIEQVEPLYGAANIFVRDAGNRQWNLSFAVTRQHASPDAALLYLSTHAAALPNNVDLQITQGADTIYLVNALMTSFEPEEPTGLSTTIRYQFVSPNLTTTAP